MLRQLAEMDDGGRVVCGAACVVQWPRGAEEGDLPAADHLAADVLRTDI